MSVEERSKAQFEDLEGRLRDEYGEFRVVDKEWDHPSDSYEHLVERFESGTAGGAGAWVTDADGRVLLVRDNREFGWSDPGGQRRPGESYEETAKRAAREATGVEITIDGVLELHRVAISDGTAPERPTLVEPIVLFLASHGSGTAEPAGATVEEVDWFTERPRNVTYEEVGERPFPDT